jgi:hypothetical protein
MEIGFEIKRTYLAILLEIGKCDREMDEWEDQYVTTIATRLNVPISDLESIRISPEKYVTKFPETIGQRIEFFYNLLFMMGINNQISDKEKELCRQIGFKLCFNPMLMDDMINIVCKYLGKEVPADEIINAVIKYQN